MRKLQCSMDPFRSDDDRPGPTVDDIDELVLMASSAGRLSEISRDPDESEWREA